MTIGGSVTKGWLPDDLLLPQLYVNYCLKIVAGMSGSALPYKFINTFFDDLSTFLSDFPLMYKIACFRDDVVFVV
jgi:hypothetical protein